MLNINADIEEVDEDEEDVLHVVLLLKEEVEEDDEEATGLHLPTMVALYQVPFLSFASTN